MSSSTPRRLWIFADVYPPAVFGAAFMTATWRDQLVAQGHDVRVFHPSGSFRRRSRDDDHVAFRTVKDLAYAGDNHARFSTVVQLLRARGELPDAILVATPGRVGLLGLAIGSRFDLPTVVVHSTDLVAASEHHDTARAALALSPKVLALAAASRPVRRSLLDARRLLPGALPGDLGVRFTSHTLSSVYADADEIVVLSSKTTAQLTSWIPDARPTELACGVDRLPASDAPVDLAWPAEGLRLVSVGRLSAEKNLPVLVEAVALAERRGVDVQLTFVGEGELAVPLQKQAAELGVGDRVRVMGPYRRDELRSVYAGAHVFGFPSVVDTQAFVLNEAAHESLPLLFSDRRVNRVAQDDVSGLAVENSPEGYADGLARLVDPALRERLGEGARLLAADLDEAGQTRALAEVVERAIAARRR